MALDAYLTGTTTLPAPLFTSVSIRDRASTFHGNIYHASSPSVARVAVKHLKHVVHASKPAYEISAWRCMTLKPGCTGLGGPDDFELSEGSDDDGEKGGAKRVLNVMRAEGVVDAVVVVSRWYGGTMLGPARFAHIETCAQEVCKAFRRKEELDDCVQTLLTLDGVLAALRAELSLLNLASSQDPGGAGSKNVDIQNTDSEVSSPDKPRLKQSSAQVYTTWTESDLPKAKRLVIARERAIASVKNLLAKKTKMIDTGQSQGTESQNFRPYRQSKPIRPLSLSLRLFTHAL